MDDSAPGARQLTGDDLQRLALLLLAVGVGNSGMEALESNWLEEQPQASLGLLLNKIK